MGTERMHDHSTRALHHRYQKGARTAALLVAALFLVLVATVYGPSLAQSGTNTNSDVAAIDRQSIAPLTDLAHEIAIRTVADGEEGLMLRARLDANGGPIERPIGWIITTSAGETLHNFQAPSADLALPPGDYMVRITYGAASFERGLTLLPGNHLSVNYVLNVGGLRVLPRVKGIGLPQAPSTAKIFALSGINQGQLIAQSDVPGEVVRLAAGEYRVESRFDAGNTLAVADVKIKPAIMTAIDIDHAAGVARLSFVGAPGADVAWDIATTSGEKLATTIGLSADVVLKPGTYIASATAGGEVMTATFAIEAGEARDIILGN